MAWDEYVQLDDRHGDDSREVLAHKVAWSAIKTEYEKDPEGHWTQKSD